MKIEVRIDEATLREADHILRAIPGAADRAMYQAINKTARSGRTLLKRIIANRYGLLKKVVDRRMHIRTANRNRLYAAVDVDTERTNLIALGAQQTPSGVAYKTFGTSKSRLRKHAFIAYGATRHMQVWLRSEWAIGRKKYIEFQGRHMEALYIQKGESLSDLIHLRDRDAVAKKGAVDLPKNINSQIDNELSKWEKRGR